MVILWGTEVLKDFAQYLKQNIRVWIWFIGMGEKNLLFYFLKLLVRKRKIA